MIRKTIFYSALTVMYFTLMSTSCGKDFTCQCEGGISGKPDPILLQETTQKKAEKACENYNTPPGTPDGYYNCKLQ